MSKEAITLSEGDITSVKPDEGSIATGVEEDAGQDRNEAVVSDAGVDSGKRSAEDSRAAIGESSTDELEETLGGEIDYAGASERAMAEAVKPDPEKVQAGRDSQNAMKPDPMPSAEQDVAEAADLAAVRTRIDNIDANAARRDARYDGRGREIKWPGQETWKQGDAALKMTDGQIAADIARKYLDETENSNDARVRASMERDKKAGMQSAEEYYQSLTPDGKQLVDRCVSALHADREKGNWRGYGPASRELTDENGALTI